MRLFNIFQVLLGIAILRVTVAQSTVTLQRCGNKTHALYPLTINGESIPFRVGAGDWPSATIVGYIFSILLQEEMGIKVEMNLYKGSSSLLESAARCTPLNSSCSVSNTTLAMFEIWLDAVSGDVFGRVRRELQEGDLLYISQQGLYAQSELVEALWDSISLPVGYYRAFLSPSRPWTTAPGRTFAKPRDFSLIETDKCYVNPIQNLAIYNLTCAPDGWWYASSCLNNKDTCVPLILDWTYSLDELLTIIGFHEMPFAVVVSGMTYPPLDFMRRNHNASKNALIYGWRPDSAYLGVADLAKISFPENNATEWVMDVFKTDFPSLMLKKYAWTGLSQITPRALSLFSNFVFTNTVITQMLLTYRLEREGGASAIDAASRVACEVLTQRRSTFLSWWQDESCPPGVSLNRFTGKCECPPGKSYDAGNCRDCPKGTFKVVSGEHCHKCPIGRFAPDVGTETCLRCGLGKYAHELGMSKCTSCPVYGVQLTTHFRGAQSVADCACDRGFYWWKKTGTCNRCTVGLQCPGGFGPNMTEDGGWDLSPLVLKGYMVVGTDNGIDVYTCTYTKSCPGNFRAFEGPGGVVAKRQCAGTSSGVSCGTCPDGTAGVKGTCKKCVSLLSTRELAYFMFAIIGAAAAGTIYYSSMFPPKALGLSYGIIVLFMQSMFVQFSLAMKYPPAIQEIRNSLRIFQFDFAVIGLPTQCATGHGFISKQAFQIIWPVLPLLGFFGWYVSNNFIVKLLNKKYGPMSSPLDLFSGYKFVEKLKQAEEANTNDNIIPVSQRLKWFWPIQLDNLVNAIVKTQNAAFIVLTKCAFSYFVFKAQPSGKKTFSTQSDVVVRTDSLQFVVGAVMAIFAIIFYSLGFLAFAIYLVYVAPKRFCRDPHFRTRFRCLWAKYHPTRWWFCVASLTHGLVLNLSALLDSARWQLLGAIFINTFYVLLSSHALPWKFLVNHVVDLITKVGLLCLGIFMLSNNNEAPLDGTLTTVLYMVSGCVPLCVVAYLMMKHIVKKEMNKVKSFEDRGEFAEKFMDTMVIVGNRGLFELRKYAFELLDTDMVHLDVALDILASTMLGVQSTNRFQWRCSPKAWEQQAPGTLEGRRIAAGHPASQDYRPLVREFKSWLLTNYKDFSQEKVSEQTHRMRSSQRLFNEASAVMRKMSGVDPVVHGLFLMLNTDGGQDVTKQEFVDAILKQMVCTAQLFSIEDLNKIFDFADVDQNGSLTVMEIANALHKVVDPLRPSSMQEDAWKIMLATQLEKMRSKCQDPVTQMQDNKHEEEVPSEYQRKDVEEATCIPTIILPVNKTLHGSEGGLPAEDVRSGERNSSNADVSSVGSMCAQVVQVHIEERPFEAKCGSCCQSQDKQMVPNVFGQCSRKEQ